MQDSRQASSSALAHAAFLASGLGANWHHDWRDVPLLCRGFSFVAEFPMVQFHVNQCGFGLMLGILQRHVRSRHVLQHHGRERKYLACYPMTSEMPGYPYRPCPVTGGIGWDAWPQNNALTRSDVRAPSLEADRGAVVRLLAASATIAAVLPLQRPSLGSRVNTSFQLSRRISFMLGCHGCHVLEAYRPVVVIPRKVTCAPC
jgi:hypothetical protein